MSASFLRTARRRLGVSARHVLHDASRTATVILATAFVVLLAAAPAQAAPRAAQSRQEASRQPNVDTHDLVKLSEDPDDWIMPGKNYSGTRFSELKQINTSDVHNLELAWTFSTGVQHGHEAAPIVVGDTMYLITPWPNIVYALDLSKDGAIKWAFQPHPERAAQGVACCDTVNRGVAYAYGKIFFNTLDDHTYALDANTGKLIWKTTDGSIEDGETMTMAPLVVKDHVIVGVSGGEMGVRGWIKGLNVNTGHVDWTAYATGPDKSVLIGKDFHPYYKKDQGENLGETTWPSKKAWMHGGGTSWGWITYDPKLNLIYYGTSNPGPWDPYQRPGANKWTATIFARDPDNGMAKWAVQLTPHDQYDDDAVNEDVLLNLEIDGKMREVLTHADRNGYMFLMDRTNGQILSAQKYMPAANTILSYDLQTGAPVMNPAKTLKLNQVVPDVCPMAAAAKDWQPTAYSPITHLIYIPRGNLCANVDTSHTKYIAGTPYVGVKMTVIPGPNGYKGAFEAWDPVTSKIAWSDNEPWPVWTGALATAGNVVFYGTLDRWFKAVDAKTGKLLWKFRLGSGSVGQPVTFRGPDGRQYVAIMAGVGGATGAIVAGNLDARDPYAALGMVAATGTLPDVTAKGGVLYVFALPKTALAKVGGAP